VWLLGVLEESINFISPGNIGGFTENHFNEYFIYFWQNIRTVLFKEALIFAGL
jgi:hypothetical protein